MGSKNGAHHQQDCNWSERKSVQILLSGELQTLTDTQMHTDLQVY